MDVNPENDTAAFAVIATPHPLGPSLWFTFDGFLPAVVSLAGDARIDDGVVRLTDALDSQQGSVVVATENVYPGFRASFVALIGDGTDTSAGGMSFRFDTNLAGSFGEQGAGNGLIVSFNTYAKEDGIVPAIEVRWQGQTLAAKEVPIGQYHPARFVGVHVELTPAGEVSVWYNSEWIHERVLIPNYSPLAGAGRFGIGARAGGLNSKYWVDDLYIETLGTVWEPYRLSIALTPTGESVIVSWAPDTAGYVLEETDNLTPSIWVNAPAGNPVTIPVGSAARFYRLRQP